MTDMPKSAFLKVCKRAVRWISGQERKERIKWMIENEDFFRAAEFESSLKRAEEEYYRTRERAEKHYRDMFIPKKTKPPTMPYPSNVMVDTADVMVDTNDLMVDEEKALENAPRVKFKWNK